MTEIEIRVLLNETIGHGEIRDVCDRLLDQKKFCEYPASVSKHHCWKGGLKQHTLEVVSLAVDIARNRAVVAKEPLNVPVIVAGALFHDLGKIDDYDPCEVSKDCPYGFKYNDHFTIVHHIVQSYQYFMEWSQHIDDYKFRLAVGHCVLAHHGCLEYGSPVTPKTKEAWAVHLADTISVRCIETRIG